MNRIIIRLFGFCASFIGIGTSYAIYSPDLPPNCTAGEVGITAGVRYQKYDCYESLTGYVAATLSGWIGCDGSGMVQFSGCSGGYCDSEIIYCPTSDYFEAQGCVNGSVGGGCYYGTGAINLITSEDGYYFLGCGTGWYQNLGSSGAAIAIPFSTDISGLGPNCSPCSGLRLVNGQFETYHNDSGVHNNSDFWWTSVGSSGYNDAGVGITSCRASTASSGLKNNVGTFTISIDEACPYVN